MPRVLEQPLSPFPTTRWTLVHRASAPDPETRRQALSELLTSYLPALRAFAIYKYRISLHNANDIVQGFITNKIIERELFTKVDPTRGKLRTLLMTALDRYFISALRAQRAQKRSDHRAVSLHDEGMLERAYVHHDPGRAFDTAWARHILARAIRETRRHCREFRQTAVWGVFYYRVIRTTLQQREPMPYNVLVVRYGFASPAQASNALITAKRIFNRSLRRIIAEYATTEEQQSGELRDLICALSSCKN